MSVLATRSIPIPAKPAAATISKDCSTDRSTPSGRRNSIAHSDWNISSFCMTWCFARAACRRRYPCAVVRIVGAFTPAREPGDRRALKFEIPHGRRLDTGFGDDCPMQLGQAMERHGREQVVRRMVLHVT